MHDFPARIEAFLAEFFRLNPTFATSIGEHAYDDRWPDLTAAGRAERLAFGERWLAEFGAMADLSADEAIDRDLLIGELEAAPVRGDRAARGRPGTHSTGSISSATACSRCIAREFAPLGGPAGVDRRPARGPAGRPRCGRGALVGHAGRPVGRFQTETALKQLPGIGELIDDALGRCRGRRPDRLRRRCRDAAACRRRGDGPGGRRRVRDPPARRRPARPAMARAASAPELFAAKMRHTMRSETLTPERILAGAEREYTAVRAEMVRIARELWPAWRPDQPIPGDDGALVRGVLDADRGRAPDGRGPARVLPRGERPDRGVLRRAAT